MRIKSIPTGGGSFAQCSSSYTVNCPYLPRIFLALLLSARVTITHRTRAMLRPDWIEVTPMPLAAATRLGPYEITAQLGAGGMGEVYRARDTRLERDVAIKVLPERFAQDHTALARFQREARAVASLTHPNILAIYDIGNDQGTVYAVMELLEGQTLGKKLKSAALDWRSALEIATAVAEGLAAAHAKGIVHRDVKPENIFLTS